MTEMTCEQVDELAGAYAFGALDADEERLVAAHLSSCPRPHAEVRDGVALAGGLADGLQPVGPSAQLRARLMASVAATPQASAPRRPADAARRPRLRWPAPRLSAALATAAVVVAIAFGIRSVQLEQEAERSEAVAEAFAAAEAIYRVAGDAGTGWLLETGDRPVFVAADVASLPAGRLYQLWLIDPAGQPVSAGTLTPAGDPALSLVRVERPLTGYATFAVTVEARREDQPTSEPVMVATLGT